MRTFQILRATTVSALILTAGTSGVAQTRLDTQVQTMPGRDQPQRFGTGVIKGRVVDGSTGGPVARARVRIMGPAGQRPSVLTDASGAFSFTHLPAGGYSLMVEKSTYLMARYPAAGRTIRSSMSRPIIVRDEGPTDAVTIAVYRGGAIAGRVLDAHGDPMEYANVRVMRLSGAGGRPMGTGSSSTNDLGEFRVSRLEAGRYLLMVVPRRMPSDELALDADLPPQPLATYYPGSPALDQAQPIALERGQTIAGIDIVLAEGTPALVMGTIVTARGEPVTTGAFVNARALVKDMPGFDDGGGASVRPDGTFRLTLAPGEYRIEAYVNQPSQGRPPSPKNEQFGIARVSLAPGSAEAVSIVVGRGATASGRAIFEGTIPVPSVPEQFRPQFFTGESGECRSGQTQFAPDWTFRIEGLNGTCLAAATAGLGGWMLKALLYDGQDLLDQPLTFEPGQELRDLQLVFTDKRTDLALRVVDEQGTPTRDYVAIVFPAAKARRTPSSRYVRTHVPVSLDMMMMLSAASGRGMSSRATPGVPPGSRVPPPEAIRGLPPGDYYAVAVDDIEMEAVRDPTVLERLIPGATRVTLSEGGNADVALRRVKLAGAAK